MNKQSKLLVVGKKVFVKFLFEHRKLASCLLQHILMNTSRVSTTSCLKFHLLKSIFTFSFEKLEPFLFCSAWFIHLNA